MCRKRARTVRIAPSSPRFSPIRASIVHSASALDQAARTTLCPKRIWRSMPRLRAVSRM
jgi:hypothetical protein